LASDNNHGGAAQNHDDDDGDDYSHQFPGALGLESVLPNDVTGLASYLDVEFVTKDGTVRGIEFLLFDFLKQMVSSLDTFFSVEGYED
jgi:hypothetical protein